MLDVLEIGRLHVLQSVNRRGQTGATKTETSVRTAPVPQSRCPN